MWPQSQSRKYFENAKRKCGEDGLGLISEQLQRLIFFHRCSEVLLTSAYLAFLSTVKHLDIFGKDAI